MKCVVVYGCKSSPDEKESVADQHRLVLEAIEKEGGRTLAAAPFGEANASGYRSERGPELEKALRAAIEAAAEHGEAELWVWHSSRLARGDGRKGKRSIQLIVAQLLYEDVIVRSVADPEMVTPMLVGIASKVASQYSADLGAHTRRGVEKRRAEGKPVGGMGLGYRTEPVLDADGKPVIRGNRAVTERVVDPASKPAVQGLFDGLDRGMSSGDVARMLNLAGHRTALGKEFNARAVREIARNPVYTGSGGYPAIIESDQWERVQAKLQRLDDAALAHKRGGRPRLAEFMLKRLVFCGECGQPMFCITRKSGRKGDGPLKRRYQCRAQVESRGTCSAHYVPAELAEQRVLQHLELFVNDDLSSWLAERLSERSAECDARQDALDGAKAGLAVLDTRREKLFAKYLELVEAESPQAHYALEPVAKLDAEREAQRQAIGEAQAALSEFTGEPNTDAVLDLYNELHDLVSGKIARARGVAEVNAALHDSLMGVWLGFDGETLTAEVRLRPTGDEDRDDLMAVLFDDLFGGELHPTPELIEHQGAQLRSPFHNAQPPSPS